jgi:HlyD family secretion protein
MTKKKKYSEEIAEIMNSIPNSIVRWGIKVLLIITLMILSGSYFVKYPEIVSTNVILIKATESDCSLYSSMYLARCPIQESFLGKIKPEQAVNIKLNAYSYYEYGLLKGKIDSIYFDSTHNTYIAVIIFPDGLITSYKKNIPFHKGMSGIAEIITQKRRIIDILLKSIKFRTRQILI